MSKVLPIKSRPEQDVLKMQWSIILCYLDLNINIIDYKKYHKSNDPCIP